VVAVFTRAVKNLRFNESPIFMLNNVEAMGRPVRVSASEAGGVGQGVVVPPLKVRDFNFTSLSDAV
jgi:predicted Zn-dependent protease